MSQPVRNDRGRQWVKILNWIPLASRSVREALREGRSKYKPVSIYCRNSARIARRRSPALSVIHLFKVASTSVVLFDFASRVWPLCLQSVLGQAELCTCKISTKNRVLNSDSLCYINSVSDMQAPLPFPLCLSCETNRRNDLSTDSMAQLPEYRHVLGLKPLPSSPQTGRKRAPSCEAAKALGRASLLRQVGTGYAHAHATPSGAPASSEPPSCARQECPLGIS